MSDVTVVRAGRVVPAPGVPALADRRIVLRHGRVQEITEDAGEPPPGATVVDATGATVVAGLWNAHVHLTPPSLSGARRCPGPTSRRRWRRCSPVAASPPWSTSPPTRATPSGPGAVSRAGRSPAPGS